ncbi:SDR family oxidoreductase, partial [Azospirillum brasilense]
RDAYARIARDHGRLDVLVQNVGQRNRKPLTDFADEEISDLLNVDLAAGLILAREAARLMLPQGFGRLITVTSISGQIARANDAVYAAAKAGLAGMVRALAAEYGAKGLTSNAIAPGFFATETNAGITGNPALSAYFEGRTPMGRWGRPEEIAGAAVFLASPAASYVNGHVLVVDGGATILM